VSDRRIADLERQIRKLREELTQRPFKPPKGSPTILRTVIIDQGNTLATGQSGCKYSSSAITSVPSAYDPSVTTSFIDGICRGTLYENGVSTGNYVLVLNDSTASVQRALVQNDVVAVQAAVSIPVAGDPNGATVSAYPALFL
jgi:hypothetical protein